LHTKIYCNATPGRDPSHHSFLRDFGIDRPGFALRFESHSIRIRKKSVRSASIARASTSETSPIDCFWKCACASRARSAEKWPPRRDGRTSFFGMDDTERRSGFIVPIPHPVLAAADQLGGGAVRRWKQGRTLRLRPGVVQPNAEIVSRILSPRRRFPGLADARPAEHDDIVRRVVVSTVVVRNEPDFPVDEEGFDAAFPAALLGRLELSDDAHLSLPSPSAPWRTPCRRRGRLRASPG